MCDGFEFVTYNTYIVHKGSEAGVMAFFRVAWHLVKTIIPSYPSSRIMIMPSLLAFLFAIYWLTKRDNRSRPADDTPKMSPDTVSSLFPDRPIRPMPKRRLKEKLSPEVAGSIKYPPSTLNSVPLFQYPPYTVKDDGSPPRPESTSPTDRAHRDQPSRDYDPHYTTRPNGISSGTADETDSDSRCVFMTRPTPDILNRAGARAAKPHTRQTNPQPPLSSASSVDGYDSFENTSNKKKRKIPLAGDSAMSNVHGLASDMSAQGGSSGNPMAERSYHAASGYPSSYASTAGISGSGRGRLGRSSGRSPLRALSDGNNGAWRAQKGAATPHWASTERENDRGGIISNAIANAEKHPQPHDQANVSLLQQHNWSNKTTPASTQFTFTCDSQVPGSLQWPGNTGRGNIAPPPIGSANAPGPPTGGPGASRPNSRRNNRRRLEKELKAAARQRKQITLDNNFHNPPKNEDLWICEFCEYESIFGVPPRALIRDYELKDRRVRQEEADRKRLLEKAKAKGRKAKKGKAPPKAANGNASPHDQQPVDDQTPPSGNGHSTQSEEDYEEDYVAEYDDGYPSPNGQVDDGGGTRAPQGYPIPRPATS